VFHTNISRIPTAHYHPLWSPAYRRPHLCPVIYPRWRHRVYETGTRQPGQANCFGIHHLYFC
jgi:hypothetical protein